MIENLIIFICFKLNSEVNQNKTTTKNLKRISNNEVLIAIYNFLKHLIFLDNILKLHKKQTLIIF